MRIGKTLHKTRVVLVFIGPRWLPSLRARRAVKSAPFQGCVVEWGRRGLLVTTGRQRPTPGSLSLQL